MKFVTMLEARKQLNLTQKELADNVNLSRATIISLESGKSLPTRKSKVIFNYFKNNKINVKFSLTS